MKSLSLGGVNFRRTFYPERLPQVEIPRPTSFEKGRGANDLKIIQQAQHLALRKGE